MNQVIFLENLTVFKKKFLKTQLTFERILYLEALETILPSFLERLAVDGEILELI